MKIFRFNISSIVTIRDNLTIVAFLTISGKIVICMYVSECQVVIDCHDRGNARRKGGHVETQTTLCRCPGVALGTRSPDRAVVWPHAVSRVAGVQKQIGGNRGRV
jgi:hypothetical protein